MKCTHCGSQWNSNTAVTACPFCHKPLNTAPNGPKTLTSTLVQIRDQLGVETLGKGKALLSSFKDIAPELKREGVMLSHLDKCDGFKTLYAVKDKSNSEQQTAVSKVVRSLTDDLFVDKSAAENICKTYMLVLTGKEKEAQKANGSVELAQNREKLTSLLRDNLPPQPKPIAPPAVPPKPAAPVAPPRPVAPPKPAAPPMPTGDFQIDAGGKLVKYNGRASVVNVPANVRVIGTKAFERNLNIMHVQLPEGLLGIEDEAFAACPNLQTVSFPSTLNSIGDKAFWACNSIKELTLPGSLKFIAPYAFWACRSLTKLTLKEGITQLGGNTFDYCDALTQIYLPQSLETVHLYAFTGSTRATVYGNNAWVVRNGHVVANTSAGSAYRNQGVNQKTVVAQPKPAAPQMNQRAYKNETPPTPPVTPPKPPVTPPKPPVPPTQPASNSSQSTKTIVEDNNPLLNMWVWIVVAVVFFLISFSDMGYPEELYGVLPLFVIIFWMGRALIKKGRTGLGSLCIFMASVFVSLFYTGASIDTWIAVVVEIAVVLMLTLTGISYKH